MVIDAKSTARSGGAIALGFSEYDKDTNIAGIIFNRVGSPNHLNILKNSLRGDIPCLGGVMRNDCMALESRHLGLVPAMEDYDPERYERIAEHVESCVDIDKIVEIARDTKPIEYDEEKFKTREQCVRIGIAKDRAFNFYYISNIEALERAGAEMVPFSPIDDEFPDVDGLYFGGGYPEIFSADLEKNSKMRAAIKKASEDGMPIYAECGGLMYMSKYVKDLDDRTYEMCGVFNAESRMNNSKRTLGYVEMQANKDNVICEKGWTVRGHEFHYSTTSPLEEEEYAFDLIRGKGIVQGKDGLISDNTLAEYTHIHFASNPKIPVRFVDNCLRYSKR